MFDQELVKALDENAMLSSRVTQLETDMKRQLHEYQRQTSDAQTTITSLHNRQMADRYMYMCMYVMCTCEQHVLKHV